MAAVRSFARVSVLGNSLVKSRGQLPILRSGVENAPGTTFPFQTKNKFRLLLTMGMCFGLAFSIPFIAVKFQLKKQSGGF